jgi:inhibitor of cysteine peptidase
MIRKTIIALLLLLTLGTGVACGAVHEINLSVKDNNGSIKAKKGDVLVITLEANASTGYTWDVASNKKSITKYKGKKYIEPAKTNPPKVGAPGKEVLRFKAIRKGISKIKLIYHQPWDNKAKPAKTFSIEVAVR